MDSLTSALRKARDKATIESTTADLDPDLQHALNVEMRKAKITQHPKAVELKKAVMSAERELISLESKSALFKSLNQEQILKARAVVAEARRAYDSFYDQHVYGG
ncbi:hypothetical protein [Vibrio harveyi]|uniref:hypothetical protein n=1 Tax=Vibrio harveyi TaxID=669 RepID=UPI0018F16410|nr:hypothetical protein [Vibrio harveyi]